MKSLTKRKIIPATICVLIFFALAELAMVNKSAKEMARRDALELGVNHLAGAIELYREDHSQYPSSLEELLLGIRTELKADIERYRVNLYSSPLLVGRTGGTSVLASLLVARLVSSLSPPAHGSPAASPT